MLTVEQLLAVLVDLPKDAVIVMHYDGGAYGDDVAAWLAQDGRVHIGDLSEPVYEDSSRIIGSSNAENNTYLRVGEMLGLISCGEYLL